MKIHTSQISVNSFETQNFSEIIKKFIRCSNCENVAEKPCECELCGEIFCEDCTEKMGSCRCSPHTLFKVKECNKRISEFIHGILFKCKNEKNGCCEEMRLSELKMHQQMCDFNGNDSDQERLSPKKFFASKDKNRFMSFNKIYTANKYEDNEIETPRSLSFAEKIDKIYDLLTTKNRREKFNLNFQLDSSVEETPRFKNQSENILNEITSLNEKLALLLSNDKKNESVYSGCSTNCNSPVSQFTICDYQKSSKKKQNTVFPITKHKKNNSISINDSKKKNNFITSLKEIDISSSLINTFTNEPKKDNNSTQEIIKNEFTNCKNELRDIFDNKINQVKDELKDYIQGKCTNELIRYLQETLLFSTDEICEKINDTLSKNR